MRDIAAIPAPSSPQERPAPGQRTADDPPAAGAPARSLVPVSSRPHRPAGLHRCPPPSAAFLAHLIAAAQHAPQTRARCRAAPADATAHYAAATHEAAASRARGWSM